MKERRKKTIIPANKTQALPRRKVHQRGNWTRQVSKKKKQTGGQGDREKEEAKRRRLIKKDTRNKILKGQDGPWEGKMFWTHKELSETENIRVQ